MKVRHVCALFKERRSELQPVHVAGEDYYPPIRRIYCADGFSLSVQASAMHYCTPRETGLDEYTAVEVGFPNRRIKLLREYAEDPKDLTGTVYARVPVKIVARIISKHGGVIEPSPLAIKRVMRSAKRRQEEAHKHLQALLARMKEAKPAQPEGDTP